MRTVIWEDRNGYTRASLIRDGDPDEAAEHGIPVELPDLNQIDFEEVKRDLHNELMRRRIITYKDVQKAGRGVTAAVVAVLKRRVVNLYKQDGGKTNE